MKKILAFIMILALLIPMGTIAHAEEAEVKPFYIIQWSNFKSELSYNWYMPYFWANSGRMNQPLESIAWNNEYDISKMAKNLKELFDTYPDGTRYINYNLVGTAFDVLQEDVIFVDKGVEVSQQWLSAFLKEYYALGGKLDGLSTGIAFEDLYAIYVHDRYAKKDPMIYKKIVENPLYATDIRPKLKERGFKFYENITDLTPEIYSIHPNSGSEYSASRGIWDAVLRSYINGKITEACEPLWEYYPEASVSDYQSKNVKTWLKELNDNGGLVSSTANITTAGTASSKNGYSSRPHNFYLNAAANGVAFKTLPGFNRAIYEDSVFHHFLYDANIFKNTYLGSDSGSINFWVAHYFNTNSDPLGVAKTPYYTEAMLHMGMLNPQYFLGFILENDAGGEEEFELSLQILDQILGELTRVVGGADRKPIGVNVTWNDYYVVSGMQVGGKNIWRLTPDTSMVSLEDFKVESNDPTFSVAGQTITFPQGKIIETGTIYGWDKEENLIENNHCGYWIETPIDVMPVTSRVESYHSTYPAYAEDYEGFEVGMEYNYKNALPVSCWEIKKVGNGSALIQADGDNQVLALTGSYTLKNVNMPKNITAGDTYAENQAWEVEVKIPSDMAGDAELILLNAFDTKKKSDDGGFKVVGNKVYYSENGAYTELSGVSLTPGNKYRFVREMNFNDAEAFSADYYVYDADGKLLGSAKNIGINEFELPVAGIGMSCDGIAGEALLLDNYKLYPTKVGYDFELYSADLGVKVKETDKAQAQDVAYRFSWMNATNTETDYKVMAAYYAGDKLVEEKVIEEIKMAPGAERIDTGIVNAPEGQSVLVYLKSDTPAADSEGKTPSSPNLILILVIAAAVVMVAAVLVLLLLPKKKTKKNSKKKSKKKSKQ